MHKNMQVFTVTEDNEYSPVNTPVKGSRVEQFKAISAQMKLRRKIEDYLRKYTTMTQLIKIADFLGISH